MIPVRIVIDTNIVVSVALKLDGLQRSVLLLAITTPARLYVSDAILEEYREVLSRPELQIRKGLRQQLLPLIRSHAHLVTAGHSIEVAKDPDDNKFLECADTGGADCQYIDSLNYLQFYRSMVFWSSRTRMATTSKRPQLTLNSEQQSVLEQTARSRTEPQREVQRAQILLRYAQGQSITAISRAVRSSRVAVYKWVDRALAVGAEAALNDKYHRPKKPFITEEAKAWVVSLACSKPKDHGYAAEVWSHRQLAKHVRENALAQGHPSLSRAAKATIQRILKSQTLQPHKVKYYMEQRDPQFDEKMREILLVYQEVNLQNDAVDAGHEIPAVITVSVDAKPGVQAIANTVPDLPPEPGQHPQLGRDYEYKRLGTLSILAGLDLHDGHVTAEVHPRHRSREFILLLKALDSHYPPGCVIRLVLDNHSAHISKETMAWLATKPNRFVYVHTPKHGSWLNLVETLFGKMARSFLKHIRVSSRQELKDRILLGIAEINQAPVVHRWKKFEALNR